MEVNNEAVLNKLLKISVFIIQNGWAHTTKFENFVKFVGNDLEETVLREYLSNAPKNATYLSTTTITNFIKVISEWIKFQVVSKMQACNEFTVMLDEATDAANRAQLSLHSKVTAENGDVENLFL